MKEKKNISISPSSLGDWMESPLLFYFKYVSDTKPDTVVPSCYGEAGGLVHDCLEKYADKSRTLKETLSYFHQTWEELSLDDKQGLFGSYLKKDKYELSLKRGIQVIDSEIEKGSTHIVEEKLKYLIAETDDYTFYLSGIIDDKVVRHDGNVEIKDWKTSSSVDASGKFKNQGSHYCFLTRKEYNQTPESVTFEYLKIDKKKRDTDNPYEHERKIYTFDEKDLDEYLVFVKGIIQQIVNNGNDVSKYDIGKIDSPFNEYKNACELEQEKRKHENRV